MTNRIPMASDKNEANDSATPSADSPPPVTPRGLRYGDLWGRWPGDINDGFEEWVRQSRDGYRPKEPPSCK